MGKSGERGKADRGEQGDIIKDKGRDDEHHGQSVISTGRSIAVALLVRSSLSYHSKPFPSCTSQIG